jgi:chorismate dehydratase
VTLNSLRIGCVKYLNARPLIRGWPGDAEFDHPSALCQRLASGDFDVALVSSFEFLRNPIYRIVDNVSISSDGPVYSVVVAHRGRVSEIEEIELDPASETSVNLLRCLLAELGLSPRLIGGDPESTACQSATGRIRRGEPVVAGSLPAAPCGRLLIGDQAVRFRQMHANEFQFWDLGKEWKKLTGFPFVYALWLIRPEVADAQQVANRLRSVRDENLVSLDQLIADVVVGVADPKNRKITRDFLSRYYRKHLRFSFGEKEKRGLQAFANLCEKRGLLPRRAREFSLV